MKSLKSYNQEVAPEPLLKAPPPTPCLSPKQKSGSVPNLRIGDFPHFKSNLNRSPYVTTKPGWKNVIELNVKKSNSDHGFSDINLKPLRWVSQTSGLGTSNLLHSVRQKLLNL